MSSLVLAQAETGAITAVEKLTTEGREFLRRLIGALPELATALVVFLLFWFASGIARRATKGLSERVTDDLNLQRLFGGAARILVLVIGAFIAAGLVFPGLEAGDLVAVLGLSSVAIGFAFKDIFENFLAGILILIQRPFHINDQIIVDGFEGSVEDIKLRSTTIETFDGERVIMPNSTLYGSPVRVRTAFETRRTTFATGIGYGEDIDEARETIRKAVESCEHIL